MLEIQQKGNMEKYIGLLKKSVLFDGIKEEELSALVHCLNGKIKTFESGETIFHEGTKYSVCAILLDGKAQMVQYDYMGNRSILSEIEPLQLFGESYSINNCEFPISIEASTRSAILLINSKNISTPCTQSCKFHILLINNLLKILSTNNMKLNTKLQCLSKRTTREKLLSYLYSQSQKHKSAEFEIPFDRQSLADYLCVERSAMSVEISKLCKDKIIEARKNKFKLLQNKT